jgi:lysophospholipase L1-like esterase
MRPVLAKPPAAFCPPQLPMTDAVFIARRCRYTSATLPRNWLLRSLFLRAHPNTRLVSVGLGADDVLLLRTQCADDPTCIALGLPQVLAEVETNLATILGDLRAAGFKGIIVVVNYYSVDYSDANQTAITAALNQALETAASTRTATAVADVFTAFQGVAASAGGRTCIVGLLNASAQDQFVCDIHPSQSGQKLIARIVEQTYVAARENAQ